MFSISLKVKVGTVRVKEEVSRSEEKPAIKEPSEKKQSHSNSSSKFEHDIFLLSFNSEEKIHFIFFFHAIIRSKW